MSTDVKPCQRLLKSGQHCQQHLQSLHSQPETVLRAWRQKHKNVASMPNVATAWSQASKTDTCTSSDLFRLDNSFLLSIQVVHLGGKFFCHTFAVLQNLTDLNPVKKEWGWLDSLSFALSVASFLRPACEASDPEFIDVYSACTCSSNCHLLLWRRREP